MAIIYDRLFETLKEKGKNKNFLRKNGVSPSIITKISNGTGGLESRTINKICALLDCQPCDIMEYKPD